MSEKKVGCPTDYNEELADLICDRVSVHAVGIQKICDMYDDMPKVETIRRWRYRHPEFGAKYAQAKKIQVETLVDQLVEISDNDKYDTLHTKDGQVCNTEYIARSRLRVDTRKWLASKLIPKIYGDNRTTEATVTVKHEDALKELE
jgi:hypothetical protein